MKRFAKGDLAITCNSLFPVNDGHLVLVTEVIGPKPEWGFSFGYAVERVDGQPFSIGKVVGSSMILRGNRRTVGDQHQLRPLRDRPEETREPREETVDA